VVKSCGRSKLVQVALHARSLWSSEKRDFVLVKDYTELPE
jgi:hypothetical protein